MRYPSLPSLPLRRPGSKPAVPAAVAVLMGLAGLAAPVVPAAAGQWTQLAVTDQFDECAFAFTGPINPGDLTAIRSVPAWNESFRKRVCLDSPGGSLKEVYDFVTGYGAGEAGIDFSTKVASGARCESSCAVLFMFGQSWGANSPYPDRVLEPGARLGFDSQFLAGASLADSQREDAFRVALDVAKLLMDKSYKSVTMAGPPLSSELVSLILNTPGEDMYYVDTVGEMALLGIEPVIDDAARIRVPATREATAALVERICASSFAMTFRQHVVREGYDFRDLVDFVEEKRTGDWGFEVRNLVHFPASDPEGARIVGLVTGALSVPGWNSAGAALYCRVEVPIEAAGEMFEIRQNASYSVSFGRAFDLDEIGPDEIPGRDDGYSYNVIAAGLIPIDTKY